MLEKYLHIHPEVQKAISYGDPVVGLDSSMIFDNSYYPKNIEVANNICKIIRNNGAVPATIAIINGILKIGLTEDELEFISLNKDLNACHKRILPFAILQNLTATTTLDTSIMLADMAGLKLIMTGDNFNSSYFNKHINNIDLNELSCKSIVIVCNDDISLDFINKTNVTIINYNETITNLKNKISLAHHTSMSSLEIAKYLKIKYDLNLNGCLIVSNTQSKNFNTESIYNNALLASKISKNLYELYKKGKKID